MRAPQITMEFDFLLRYKVCERAQLSKGLKLKYYHVHKYKKENVLRKKSAAHVILYKGEIKKDKGQS